MTFCFKWAHHSLKMTGLTTSDSCRLESMVSFQCRKPAKWENRTASLKFLCRRERILNTKAQNVAGISESEEGAGKGQGRHLWKLEIPDTIATWSGPRESDTAQGNATLPSCSSIHPSSVQCHIPDTVTTTIEAPPSWGRERSPRCKWDFLTY